jgi:bifunctional non-homologous end joining protein LigD
VEDHPIEYGDFEGMIPEGNYGAGAVIVWDRGRWTPLEDPIEGMKKGKLLFTLQGNKLHGRWTLVKMKKEQKEWLLIKERDGYATTGDGERFPQDSVLSGLTVEELKAGKRPGATIREKLERLGAAKRALRVEDVELALAETRERPFSRPGWIYELKYDGYRLLAARERGDARLLSRNGNDLTVCYPDVARAVQALPLEGVILDGEVVVLDEAGRPNFGRLQQRAKLTRPAEVRVAAAELPATFFAFDLIACEGHDVRSLPLVTRKQLLREVLPESGVLRYTDHIEEHGEDFYAELMKLDLEGMVAKDGESRYRGGRTSSWIKVRADQTDDFVAVGFTRPKGSRAGFGALHLADYVNGELTYAGRAGSGFTAKQISEVMAQLDALRRPDPPCNGPIPKEAGTSWVEPKLVCEVRYRERTDDGLLRQPVFERFRDDKKPEDCVRRGRA